MITYQGSIIYSDGFFVEPPVPHPDPYNPLNLPNTQTGSAELAQIPSDWK